MQPGFTLAPRDPFADAKQTLSSWDNCMAKDYCKWPVIVAIIVGGIIAFSVIFCIARCICCGAECAICCCKCCTCCCGSDSGHKRMKSENQGYPPPQPYPQQPYASPNPYAEARSFAPPPPPPPQINTQYQSHPPPAIARQPSNPNFNPQVNPKFAARPASPEQPQYATFDARSRPVNDDALPEMPSWNNARSVHVEVEEEAVPEKRGDVEMDRLNHNGSVPSSIGGVAGAAAVGGVAAGMRGSPAARSPVSPVGDYGFPNQNGYDRRPSPAQLRNMSPAQSYNNNTSPYHTPSPYGAPQNTLPRGPSPAQSYSQYSQASDPYASREPYTQPYANLAAQNPYAAQDGYNTPSPTYPAPLQCNQQTDPYHSPHQHERYNSPAPPSYHTTAPPPPLQNAYGNAYASDPVNRTDTATPSAYPGQATYASISPSASTDMNGAGAYRAFTPQSSGSGGQQGYQAVSRKAVGGSLREV